jgi:hypothetical protein
VQKGIHVIDNSNPAAPRNISFINIPGNVDIAVKGNSLYADCYSDIVVFDISNPANVSAKKFMDNVLPENGGFWGNIKDADSVMVLTGYQARDTVVNCETYNSWYNCRTCIRYTAGGDVFLANIGSTPSAASAPGTGVGGSMARFSVVNDYLYAVSHTRLYAIDIATSDNPVLTNTKQITNGIETIYPFKDKLFIGSTTGMFIYDISTPSNPVAQGQFSHVRSCDPVITDGQKAYVTLRSGNECQGFTNQLDVLDVSNLNNPSLLKTYPMTNPHGLSMDNDLLFVCDGKDGLKIYDPTSVSFKLVKSFNNFETYDVIALNGTAIVVAKDGLYQYDYSNASDIRYLSKMSIIKK